jgi:glycosyltransferase involved in cell wall biosynthesis
MKISIVIGYYNREKLLSRTLSTIRATKHDDYEIIIVDDASDKPLVVFWDKVKVIRIEPKDKRWINPCMAYNIGFKVATGDVVIIQNPECAHQGDVLTYVAGNIEKNTYLSISCYEADEKMSELIDEGNCGVLVGKVTTGWMNHPYYNPINFHFCTAIMKEDLDEMGGFDERYAKGQAFDDTEFIRRIYRKGMNIKAVEYPFVIHQHHGRGHWNNPALLERNRNLYEKEYLPGEKKALTERIKPKGKVKHTMKLGVSYNVFDGSELLLESILSVRNSVDHISVVYQGISNTGNKAKEDITDMLSQLIFAEFIDDIVYFTPDLKKPAAVNELNKRNIGLVNSHDHGCTHHLSMDVDEFYEAGTFKSAKNFLLDNDYDTSACRMLTYYKNNTTILWPPESYFVPFIIKIRPGVMYSFMNNWPVLVDPTRRVVPGKFHQFDNTELCMHHFSYVRKDLRTKLENSSARVNFTDEKIIKVLEYFNYWKPGMKALFAPATYYETAQTKAKFLLKWEF